MTQPHLPTLFVSHGAPPLALAPGPIGDFWHGLAQSLPRPSAVLAVSAHWFTDLPLVAATAQPETIHDFYGFPEEFYRITYPAPGAPELAQRVLALLHGAGIPAAGDAQYGLDHGAWVPLKSFYPEADVKVAQLSVQPMRDARWHYRIGKALRPLRDEGVLVLGTGGATHNLGEIDLRGGPPPAWATAFDDWLGKALESGDLDALLDWETKAPFARRAHPSPEHFLPLFVALGAAGADAKATRLHRSFSLGGLSMAAFKFADAA
ncbi:MAG TPA: class III extradiol ring-cleavage dioxygenase [Stellaceae bacterium]|nr:class III extradiol ring-cleavage dioxygenase [Stellaceae bacterium]